MKKHRNVLPEIAWTILLLATAVLAAGCGDEGEPPGSERKTLPQEDRPEEIPFTIVDALRPLLEEARAAAEKNPDVTPEAEKDAGRLARLIRNYDYSRRPAFSYPAHTDSPRDGESGEETGMTGIPELSDRPFRDSPARWAAELAGLGAAALPEIIDNYITIANPEARAQLLTPLHTLGADDDIIDRLLLTILKHEPGREARNVAALVAITRKRKQMIPGFVDVAVTAISTQRMRTALSLVYFFQHPDGGEVKLTEEQMELLRVQFRREEGIDEDTRILFARSLAVQGDAEATEFLIDSLLKTSDRNEAVMLLHFLGDRKIAAAAKPLAEMLKRGGGGRITTETIRALGEIGSALEGDDRKIVVGPLADLLKDPKRIRIMYAAPLRLALAATGGGAAVDALIEAMTGHEQSFVRLQCVRGLTEILENGNAPKDKLVKALKAALEQWPGSDGEMQFAYIRMLGAGAEAADAELKGRIVSDLLHLLRSGRTEWLQSGAAEALGNFPIMQIVTDGLIEALQKSKSDEVRFYVIKSLGALGDSRATEPLIDAARTGSATVVDACTLSIHDLAKKGAFDPRKLFEEYGRPGAGEGERANLLRCLAGIEGSEADGLLLDALSSGQDTQLRRDVLKYLDARLRAGYPPPPGLEDALIRILESRDRPLYTGAVTLLVNLKSTKSLQHIEKVLQDNISDKLIRIVALRALAVLGEDESVRTLLRYASKMNARTIQEKENQELSNDVFAALQMCDRELLRRVLDEIIEKPPDQDMRFAALVATSIFKSGEFRAPLMEIMNDENASPRARSGAIVALGNRKEEKALPMLKVLMASGEPDIAYSTAVALGSIKDLSGALPLIRRLREEILKSERDRLLVDLIVKALNRISGGANLGEDPTAWQEWYNRATESP